MLYSSNYYNGLSYCVSDRSGGVKDTAADDIQTLVVFDITYSGVQTPSFAVIISEDTVGSTGLRISSDPLGNGYHRRLGCL